MSWTVGENPSSQVQSQKPLPQTMALQSLLARMMFDRYQRGPQSFQDFVQGGSQPRPNTPLNLTLGEASLFDPFNIDPAVRAGTVAKNPAGFLTVPSQIFGAKQGIPQQLFSLLQMRNPELMKGGHQASLNPFGGFFGT